MQTNKLKILSGQAILSLVLALMTIFLFSCSKLDQKSFIVTESYRITSANGSDSFLSIDLPLTYAYQTIGDFKVLNAGEFYFEEQKGYRTLHAKLKGSGKTDTLSVVYEVILKRGKFKWKEAIAEEYLTPEKYIDSDNEVIADLAASLKTDGDRYKTAHNIFRYVSKNIGFDHSTKINREIPLASEVLRIKSGVCQDYANLMTALFRAAGIPAKSISGITIKRFKASGDWSSPATAHAWVEFCLDGDWYFADPTWGRGYFTYSDGCHLSYGLLDVSEKPEPLKENNSKKLILKGAMSAPITFRFWSEDENASIIPRVDIRGL